jgi:RNase adaptor protein for sRNA GlmZ degradation
MRTKNIALEDLSMDNVRDLSEKEVSDMLSRLVSDYPKEKRPRYTNILCSSFEFKYIESRNHALKEKMLSSGFKFFGIPYNTNWIMAVRKVFNAN